MKTTTTQLMAGLDAVRAIADSIRELGQVPAGTLYAVVMGSMSHEAFEKVIALLVKAELVKRDESHLLHWIGPSL